MNALTYEVKRAHWRGTWHAIRSFRARAKKIGAPMLSHMTPARFDILYIAWRADWAIHERRYQLGLPPVDRRIPMGDLRDLLGLAGPTISRTAHQLADLRYVDIVPDTRDRRRVVVVLNELGAKLLHLAVECIRQADTGMRDCIARHIMLHDDISASDPRLLERLLASLGPLVDRWRSYARYFWCTAKPIYDPRVMTDLRPLAHSMMLGWGG